jgi:N-acetylmuramoyl-L-alanine amidase
MAVESRQVTVAGLAPGACMSFAPTGGRAGKTVFIDPGHGGLDPGVVGSASGRPVLEKDVALSVGMRLAELLRNDGYGVVQARTSDSSVAELTSNDSVFGALTATAVHRDLVTRIGCANAASADVLLSIHFDAFDDPSVGGAETFYDAARPFTPESKRLAGDLQSALVAALGVNDRGVWADDQIGAPTLTASGRLYDHLMELGPAESGWVDNPSQMPGALVEPLFLTNPAEARLASDPAGRERIAEGLRTGLERYFAGA